MITIAIYRPETVTDPEHTALSFFDGADTRECLDKVKTLFERKALPDAIINWRLYAEGGMPANSGWNTLSLK